jgi:hypothetical protein
MAVFEDRSERLIYLGRSSVQVRANFTEAFLELFDDEDRDLVKHIALQRWQGAPDQGRRLHHTNLAVPSKVKLAKSA